MKKILVVEDNPQNLYLVRFLLEKSGYRVAAAQNGFDAVRMAQQEQPDLILMDIQLPQMDGYEATRRIKEIVETNRIPVVAFTSYAMAGDKDKALKAGCAGYIEKPLDPDTFIAEIDVFLTKTF